MLVQFTVENFLSFKEKTTLSMVAASGDQQHPAHVVADGIGKAPALLRAAALYGANAAGKSNLVKAARFAQNLITRGRRSGQTIPVTPFRLDNISKRPSRFEFNFTHQGILYAYGFVLNSSQILEEWLYATPKKQEVRYFERVTLENKEVKVEFGRSFTGRSRDQAQFLEFIARGTRPNQLFLTEAMDRNVAQVAPVIHWFANVLTVISAEAQALDLEMTVHKSSERTDFMVSFLRMAGTGIEGVVTEEAPLDFDRYFPDMPESVREDIIQRLQDVSENEETLLLSSPGDRYVILRAEEGELKILLLRTQHRATDGRLIDFNVDEESEGTQRLIHLIPALLDLKEQNGKVILLDELDRRLHPLLSRLFVKAFLDCNESNKKSQLIFTTHETSLLDLDLLRRDEIWFVEKDPSGASHIYSLAEFKIRPDLKIEKGYLNGRFGAVPFVGDIYSLGWTASEPQNLVEA